MNTTWAEVKIKPEKNPGLCGSHNLCDTSEWRMKECKYVNIIYLNCGGCWHCTPGGGRKVWWWVLIGALYGIHRSWLLMTNCSHVLTKMILNGCVLQIRLSLENSFDYRITSNVSHEICVCSNEAKSVRFSIVPKKLGQIPLAVVAKDLDTSVCGQGVEQMSLGVSDAVIRKLLVEVCLSCSTSLGLFCCSFRFIFSYKSLFICFLIGCNFGERTIDQEFFSLMDFVAFIFFSFSMANYVNGTEFWIYQGFIVDTLIKQMCMEFSTNLINSVS